MKNYTSHIHYIILSLLEKNFNYCLMITKAKDKTKSKNESTVVDLKRQVNRMMKQNNRMKDKAQMIK